MGQEQAYMIDAMDKKIAALTAELADERRRRERAEADLVKANRILGSCDIALGACWRDAKEWVQFGRYNAEGVIPGSGPDGPPGPLPDPPQRPTVAGVNYTDQNIAVIEEVLGWIHKHLNGLPAAPAGDAGDAKGESGTTGTTGEAPASRREGR